MLFGEINRLTYAVGMQAAELLLWQYMLPSHSATIQHQHYLQHPSPATTTTATRLPTPSNRTVIAYAYTLRRCAIGRRHRGQSGIWAAIASPPHSEHKHICRQGINTTLFSRPWHITQSRCSRWAASAICSFSNSFCIESPPPTTITTRIMTMITMMAYKRPMP